MLLQQINHMFWRYFSSVSVLLTVCSCLFRLFAVTLCQRFLLHTNQYIKKKKKTLPPFEFFNVQILKIQAVSLKEKNIKINLFFVTPPLIVLKRPIIQSFCFTSLSLQEPILLLDIIITFVTFYRFFLITRRMILYSVSVCLKFGISI